MFERLLIIALALTAFAAPPAPAAALSVGGRHTLALRSDGTVRAWGFGGFGQLGDGRRLAFETPTRFSGLSAIRAISAGGHHTLALREDGTVLGRGDNSYGQIGDGSTVTQLPPVRVSGLSGVVAVQAAWFHSVALKGDGTVWTWGTNGTGQLGDGTLVERHVPVQAVGLSGVTAIAAPAHDLGFFTLALTSDGTVWSWGHNEFGRLGASGVEFRSTPQAVPGLSGVTAITTGTFHALALRSDGTVWAWGANFGGQLGDGTQTSRANPMPVVGLTGVTAIAAGMNHSLALKSDGTVWAWGSNRSGAIGDGTQANRRTPVAVTGLSGITAIAAAGHQSFALRNDGAVWAWGYNAYGQLGDGTHSNERRSPVRVAGLPAAMRISAGHFHSVALASDGAAYGWGGDGFGQLGFADSRNRPLAGAVAGLSGVTSVSAGTYHNLALGSDGTVWSWGYNDDMQLGDGTAWPRSAPVAVAGLSAIRAVSAGWRHSLALRSDGTVWAWGFNGLGALGNPEASALQGTPLQVPGLTGVIAIGSGYGHSVALRSDGTVWTWGDNSAGQLGNGGATGVQDSPAQVPGLDSVVAIAAGTAHTLALRSDGGIWAWGDNTEGAVGDATNTLRRAPVRVADLGGVIAISAGNAISLARKADTTVWAWGYNRYLQLGDGTNENRNRPVQVRDLVGAAGISAGGYHAAALMSDGTLRAWGWNVDGQIGDGTLADRSLRQVPLREGGAGTIAAGDWFLDLEPGRPKEIAAREIPVFKTVTSGDVSVTLKTKVEYRAQDVGTSGGVFVFALAPATLVANAAAAKGLLPLSAARGSPKDAPVACVLAQLDARGQLIAVSYAGLQAYVTGVLSAQGQAVSVLDGVPAVNIGGATFYVGYGANASAMFANGTNRSVATIPGSLQCQPQAPQTGWWWNPAEDGRGFSIEVQGSHYFFAAFLYDVSGRSTWLVSTGSGVSLDGSLIQGDLLSARGGQALGGAYPGFPSLRNEGAMTMAFNSASAGTLVWPGGTVPIQRFNIIPNGLNLPAVAGQPESGWWWNEQEAGRGFFMEWQGGTLDIAGYMYDDAGNPVWYLTVGEIGGTAAARSFSGSWWSYGDGMTLAGPWRQHRQTSNNVAPVTITFSGPDTALMTLPNGRATTLRRHRF